MGKGDDREVEALIEDMIGRQTNGTRMNREK